MSDIVAVAILICLASAFWAAVIVAVHVLSEVKD